MEMQHFLLILTVFLPLTYCQTTRNCYTCATSELKDKWYLTGLAPVPDSYFTAGSCQQAPSNTFAESCSGPCLTMAFGNPDAVGSEFFKRN